jgi:hypothetical protein
MTYVLRYRSSRFEVWRWYWRTWRTRLWRIHITAAFVLGFLMSRVLPGLDSASGWAAASIITFVVFCTFSVVFSQLAFKSAERTLTLDEQGWSTQIGTKTGARKWNDTTPIYEQSGAIVIAYENGNALIIPKRAFTSDAERSKFLLDVRGWQQHVA